MTQKGSNTLAMFGGEKVIKNNFTAYNSLGEEEKIAVNEVMEKGVLSKFLGCWHEDFYGGEKVRALEEASKKYFGVKHAITVNSWTSGLIAAVGALDIEPGDEIIVSPWTMCASATAILHWNAIPVFADISPDTFNIDPVSIENNITARTKAIIAVDIFGQSADMAAIMDIADRHNLKVISDTAQAPGALYDGKHAGTLAHIGGYSLNYHKHIHAGEGGIIVTNDDQLAERMRLIRNHAEAVVGDKQEPNINNMLGYNFRLGEIESAIAIEQLKKLDSIISIRQSLAQRLNQGLANLKGLKIPKVQENSSHVYYIYAMILDLEVLTCSRKSIVDALAAEGVEVSDRYQNLHLLPMYQQKIAYGTQGFPWSSECVHRDVSYQKGICPVAEALNDNNYIGFGMCVYELSNDDIDLIIKVFTKVWANLESLA
ncbi:MAG: perosamine synthetase [Marinobacter maritimus]|jgi:perosamine synthetase